MHLRAILAQEKQKVPEIGELPPAGENFVNLQFFFEFETLFQQKLVATNHLSPEELLSFKYCGLL